MPNKPSGDQIIVALLAAAGLGMATQLDINVAEGHTTSTGHLTYIHRNNDRWYNYDFTQQNHSSQSVDWAVNLIFQNGGEVDKVKDDLYWGPVGCDNPLLGYVCLPGDTPCGSQMNMMLNDNDGPGEHWDADRGTKNPNHGCCDIPGHELEFVHARIYAPTNDDQFDTLGKGYYVIATSHKDFECINAIEHDTGGSAQSEEAEEELATRAENVLPGNNNVIQDLVPLDNAEGWPIPRPDGSDEWHNDGKASLINCAQC
jgi:hypothetical protein